MGKDYEGCYAQIYCACAEISRRFSPKLQHHTCIIHFASVVGDVRSSWLPRFSLALDKDFKFNIYCDRLKG